MKMNRNEFEAWSGIPALPQRLYVVISNRMDYTTGIVGIKYSVSWRILSKELETPAISGRKIECPGRHQVRHAAAILESSGLIKNVTESGDRKLVILCCLATTDENYANFRFNRPVAYQLRAQNIEGNPANTRITEESAQEVRPSKSDEVSPLSCNPVKIKTCVFRYQAVAREFFLKLNFLISEKKTSDRELHENIREYLDFCAAKNANPSVSGCERHVLSQHDYRQRAAVSREVASELFNARQSKLRALANREEFLADNLASETIYKMSSGFRHE